MSRDQTSVRNHTQGSTKSAQTLRAEHLAEAALVAAGGTMPEAFDGDPVFAELVEQTRRGLPNDPVPGL